MLTALQELGLASVPLTNAGASELVISWETAEGWHS